MCRLFSLCFTVIWMCGLLVVALPGTAQPPGEAPPPHVGVVVVEPQDLPVAFDFIGVTGASRTVEVRSRTRGFIETREFEEGQRVTQGTPLFTVDARPFEADLEIAKAQVAQAEARARLAGQEVERLRSVNEPAAIAQSDLDTRIAEQSNAAAALRLTKAQLAKAELELSYTKISSPLDGYIGKALKEIGSLVDDNQNSLLAMVWQVNPIYVSFQVSEREFLDMRRQSAAGELRLKTSGTPKVAVTLLNGTVLPQQGTLNFESAVVDVQTGSVEMRAALENPDSVLKPGQFVTASLRGWHRPGVIAVPRRAVGQSPQGAYLYVVGDDNKAVLRIVETGQWSDDLWIIDSGLEAGESVVVEGLIKVQPGIEVSPHPYVADAAEAPAETAASEE